MPDAWETVQTHFSYDPNDGVLTWICPVGTRVKWGDRAGSLRSGGYRRVGIFGKQYAIHRIIWLWWYRCWPSGEIDHINGNRDDNRIENLRLATSSQNKANSRRRKRRLPKGVTQRGTKFQARLAGVNLGHFSTLEAAHAAYCEAARGRFAEYARID